MEPQQNKKEEGIPSPFQFRPVNPLPPLPPPGIDILFEVKQAYFKQTPETQLRVLTSVSSWINGEINRLNKNNG